MKKTSRIKLFGITALAAVIALAALGMASCKTTSIPENPTNEELGSVQIRTIQPGETVKALEIERKSSLEVDLNTYEGGTWYVAHRDKIVAVLKKNNIVYHPFGYAQTPVWEIHYIE